MDNKPAPVESAAPARTSTPEQSSVPAPAAPPPANGRRHRKKILAVVILIAVVVAVGWYYLRFIAPFETTDDAFIDGRVILISPRVPGPVTQLFVDDNQHVRQGEPLLEIDPRDYDTRLAQARADDATAQAQSEQARAQIAVDEAKAAQQAAAVIAAEAEANRAAADLKRYESVESRAVSASQLDLARAQAQTTDAALQVARNQAKAADAQATLSRASADAAEARIKQTQANLRQAELDLSYTKVNAPVNGRVTERTVEAGNYVQTGQSLLALVPDEIWVVANFKETQLTHMRTNQPVEIRVDAYPGKTYKGHVDSIQAGTGARFSLLPPENAVGNYVKVVQRVPVKIVFDEMPDPALGIAPGMSVSPKVRVN